jgi:hypothetical protein
MKRPLRWIVLLLAVAFLGGAAFVGYCCLSFVPLFFFPEEFDKDEVAYAADAKIDGFDFEVKLFRNHPMLAEYRKIVKVKQGDKLLLEKEFIDTGGLASFYLLRQGDRISVLDGIRDGFVLHVKSGEISKVDIDSIPEKFSEQAFGRFMFVYHQKRSYKWVLKEEIPPEAK